MRVAGETRGWTEGGLTIFDDSFEHEVYYHPAAKNKIDAGVSHGGREERRLVLIVDFLHPDLEEAQGAHWVRSK